MIGRSLTLLVTLACASGLTAAGAPPAEAAPAPATRPSLPGADIDVRSACAVATAVVVAEADDVDPRSFMSAFDGDYKAARITVSKRLKGGEAGLQRVWLPTPSGNRPDVAVPQKGMAYVFFLWSDGPQDLRAIKIVPETPEVVRQAEEFLAAQAAGRGAGKPASRPAGEAGEAQKPADLAGTIVLADGAKVERGNLPATLRLTNRSHARVRVCTRGGSWRSAGGAGAGVLFTPGRYKSDSPPKYDFARHIVELAPGESADIPVEFAVDPGVTHVRLTASYEVDEEMGAGLDVWAGTATADPVD